MIANRKTTNFSANTFDHTAGLVPHDNRWNTPSAAAVHAVNVTAADTARFDADQDFFRRGAGDSLLHDFECGGADQFKRFHD